MKPVLTNEQIVDYLMGDLDAYQENIREMLVGVMASQAMTKIYWDAWFRGATGKDLENADKGIIYKPENKMYNITNPQISFEIYGDYLDAEINFGALTLKRGDKEYIFDSMTSIRSEYKGFTEFEVNIAEDKEIFDECKYDLEEVDLFSDDLSAEFYIGGDVEPEQIEKLRFSFTYGSMTKVINVKLEE